MPRPDPPIDEIRAIRHALSARFDHDPARLVAYYMELQKKGVEHLFTRSRLVEPDAIPSSPGSPAVDQGIPLG